MHKEGGVCFLKEETTHSDGIIYRRSAMADIFLNMLKLLTKWKPVWLYETMPYIYSVAGFSAVLYFDTPAGDGAGALLLIAALLIWKTRKENRSF
jgi:hypothetical protein